MVEVRETFVTGLRVLLSGPFRHNANTSILKANPNNAKVWDYGRIEWHGATARLITGGSRPLNLAAFTLSQCPGATVSSEDPRGSK